jgi:DNA polymerase
MGVIFADNNDRRSYIQLVNIIKNCKKCNLCDAGGERDVGDGHLPADIMFVGEAFGIDEKDIGSPFIGRAGQLIRSVILKHRISVGENDVDEHIAKGYICNTVCCFVPPPENSNAFNGKPDLTNINACKLYLWQKIQYVKPKVIITLGAIPTKTLLKIPIDDYKWKISENIANATKLSWPIGNIYIVPAFHPSYVLRQGKPENLMKLYDIVIERAVSLLNDSC